MSTINIRTSVQSLAITACNGMQNRTLDNEQLGLIQKQIIHELGGNPSTLDGMTPEGRVFYILALVLTQF